MAYKNKFRSLARGNQKTATRRASALGERASIGVAFFVALSLLVPLASVSIIRIASAAPDLPSQCSGSIGDYNVLEATGATMNGTSGKDFIYAGDSNSININGNGGDDCIFVGDDNTGNLMGGSGDDVVVVGSNNDGKVEGEGNNDKIVVGDNNSEDVKGGNGNDEIVVGNGNSGKIEGGGGNDEITVGNGNSGRIKGGNGDDEITVGDNNSGDVEGEGGDDTITVGCGNTGNINGGGGNNDITIGGECEETARLRAFKYFDADQNGQYDGDDYPLANWNITLYEDNGFTNIGTKTTGADGYTDYWEDVPVENADELWLQEEPVEAGWIAINPADERGFGTYRGLEIESGGSYDFSFGNWMNERELASISGYKWNDLNGNGARDDGESVLPGWRIELNGGVSTQTDATGFYSFSELPDGDYLVCEVFERNPDGTVAGGWMQTYPPDNQDAWCFAGPPTGHWVTIEGGNSVADINFGNWTGPEEHNSFTIYKYDNDSGDWISEWEMCLYSTDYDGDNGDGINFERSGEAIACDETGDDFDDPAELSLGGLESGWYVIDEEDLPGWRFVGWDGDINYEAANEELGQLLIWIEAGSDYEMYFYNQEEETTVIAGYKWNDLDGNGEWHQPNGASNEPGVEGWTIGLGRVGDVHRETDEGPQIVPIEIVALALTGSDGSFRLETTESGNFVLLEERRDGWTVKNPTTPGEWAIDSFFDITYRVDFDNPPAQWETNSFFDVYVGGEFVGGEFDGGDLDQATVDYDVNGNLLQFGNWQNPVVTGYKWDDRDGSGEWDKEEPGIEGWIMALGRVGRPGRGEGDEQVPVPIEIVAMTLTGSDGGFRLGAPSPGNYKLFEENANGWTATNPRPTPDSFFDITYDLDAIAIGDPDFDLLRVTGDPDFDLLRSSFFDVFVEISGQVVGGGEEDAPFHFGNHKEPVTEPPFSPSPTPPPGRPIAGTSEIGYSVSGGGSDGVAFGGGGNSGGSGTGGGQVLGVAITQEELIQELRMRIAMYQARLIGLFRARLTELRAQLLALIAGQ